VEQYPIPQFIEQEGKIAFFISFRQFFYIVGAGAICFVLYYILPFWLFMILSVAIFGGALALAFITINGVPLINMIFGSIGFAVGGKNYVWKKRESPYPFKPVKRARIKKIEEEPVLQAQSSQLRRLGTKVETKGK
jgi:hypothetical protein